MAKKPTYEELEKRVLVLEKAELERKETDRKRTEEALKQNRDQFESILSNIQCITYRCALDKDWTMMYMSPHADQLTGYPHSDFINNAVRTYESIIYREDTDYIEHRVREAIESGKPWELEYRIRHRDGRLRWVYEKGNGVIGRDGTVAHLYGFIYDITEKKRLKSQLLQAQKMEAIGTLAGGIAHDFNNILYAMIGYIELSLDDVAADSLIQKKLEKVLKAALRAKDMVQQILSFSRHAETEKKAIEVQSVVNEALTLLRTSIPSNIRIRKNFDENCRPILGDSTQIHQVVINLVTNAFHAMREEGGRLTLTLIEEKIDLDATKFNPDLTIGTYLRFTVSDTGHGMDNGIVQKIYDPYFSTKGPGKGTGMGLAVVHGIVKDHRGSIRVDSKLGEGTSFDVYLPVIETEPVTPETPAREPVIVGAERILLVDDDKTLAVMLQQVLHRQGFQVMFFTDSVTALEAFRAAPDGFDLVITDMSMPNMTGVELAAHLKEIRPLIPIIICTGFSEIIDENKAMDMGISAFVMKPVLKDEMVKTIRNVLDKATEE